MNFSVVTMQEKRTVRFENAIRFLESWEKEGFVVLERVGIRLGRDVEGPVALSLESLAISIFVLDGLDLSPFLGVPGVERRVDINKIDGFWGDPWEDFKIICKEYLGHL